MSVTAAVQAFLALVPDGVERAEVVEHFRREGYRGADVERALDRVLEKGEAVELRLVFHVDNPEATDGPQLPPVSG